MSRHQPTIGDVRRQTDRRRTKKEILRLLKRGSAARSTGYSPSPARCPQWDDLRPAREAKGITLTTVAQHFGVWLATISTRERGLRRDDDLTTSYRAWFAAA